LLYLLPEIVTEAKWNFGPINLLTEYLLIVTISALIPMMLKM